MDTAQAVSLTNRELQDLRTAIHWAKDAILDGIDPDDPELNHEAHEIAERLTAVDAKLRSELYRRNR